MSKKPLTASRRISVRDVMHLALPLLVLLVPGAPATAQPTVIQPVDAVIQPACPLLLDPAPTGILDRPADNYGDFADHYWMHSSVELQGQPATEKFAPGLFFQPTTTPNFGDFRSAVIVNNPSPTNVLQFQIFYFSTTGVLLNPGAPVITLQPDGTHTEMATPLLGATPVGLGSALIVSVNGEPLVGGTIHHTYLIGNVPDPDFLHPGATSMQQLQLAQDSAIRLFWGPLPTTNTNPHDFLNGILPFFWVHNPNNAPNTVTIDIRSRGGIVLPLTTVTLAPFGSRLDLTLFNLLAGIYLAPASFFDDDFFVTVTSSNGLPLIGEGVMTDFFANGGPWNLEVGQRFRMGSTMMANGTGRTLINPELTVELAGPPLNTLMGIWNPGAVNVGPVRIEYRDRNGAPLGVDTVASFPGNSVLRIGPGLASSPNFPAGPVFAGWVRITACQRGLVGWTMREVVEERTNQFRKVYGEELQGANGLEPGPGFAVTAGGQARTRKVGPLVRVDDGFFWPSYTTMVNNSASNIGSYEFRLHNFPGAAIGLGSFLGLPWGRTSFTYEDPLAFPFVASNGSIRVDHASGRIEGVKAIGDPIWEWNIGFPPPPPIE